MLRDEKWPVARLIPISSASGVEAQERRLASATLAVMSAVPEFAHALLKPFGVPVGRIETFIEVPFKLEGKAMRPDGLILSTRGSKTWSALVEAKTASHPLEPNQVGMYLDLAKELSFDAVLTISNQYVTSSNEYPIEIDRRKLKRVGLHHWSWIDLLTEAVVLKEHRGISDPDQAYILGELIRYLSDDRSGAVAFDGMGASWTAVREGAREGTLRRGDPDVAAVASRWDDLLRYLSLSLTAELGRQVKSTVATAERSPTARRDALTQSLAARGQLYGELSIPDAAGTLLVVADLRARQVVVSSAVDGPREGTSRGRVSWLIRQLQQAPDTVKIEARQTRTSATLVSTLALVREDPSIIYPEKPRELRAFVLSLSANMGLKRATGRGTFVDSLVSTVESFYATTLQNLRAWKPGPPKLKKPPHEAVPETAEAIADAVGVSPADIATDAMPGASPEPPTENQSSSPSDLP